MSSSFFSAKYILEIFFYLVRWSFAFPSLVRIFRFLSTTALQNENIFTDYFSYFSQNGQGTIIQKIDWKFRTKIFFSLYIHQKSNKDFLIFKMVS